MSRARPLTPITADVWVATSRNYRTTSTIVARDGRALLIDPAWDPDELEGLAAAITDLGLTVTSGFNTHAHFDHLLWHSAYGTAPRWATARTVEQVAEHREELAAQMRPALAECVGELFGQVQPVPGRHLPEPFGADAPDEVIEVIVHDGHVPGHGGLWFPERRLLVAADMLSDFELPLPFNPDDLGAYLKALDVLTPYVERARWLIIGHGAPTSEPLARLAADRSLLEKLSAGEEVDDPRRAAPGGEEAYAKLKSMARAL